MKSNTVKMLSTLAGLCLCVLSAQAGRGEIGNWMFFGDSKKIDKFGYHYVAWLLPTIDDKLASGTQSEPTGLAVLVGCKDTQLGVLLGIDEAPNGAETDLVVRYGNATPSIEKWPVRDNIIGFLEGQNATAFFDRLRPVTNLEVTINGTRTIGDKKAWTRSSNFELGDMSAVLNRLNQLCPK